jgi:restriction system protein
MGYSEGLQAKIDEALAATARAEWMVSDWRNSRGGKSMDAGCLLFCLFCIFFIAFFYFFYDIVDENLRLATLHSLLALVAAFAVSRLWRWQMRRRAAAKHRAGYSARKNRVDAQWQAVLEVIESHAGTLSAERRVAVTTDKWGRSVGVDSWSATRREFTHDVLPDLVDCSWMSTEVQRVVEELLDEVARAWQAGAQTIPVEKMSGLDFEHLCASILESAGWQTRLTPQSGDQGVDIVATKGSWSVAIQCKRQQSPVSNAAVQQVRSGLEFYRCSAGAVVSSSPFTRSARALAASTNIRLFAFEQLHHLEPW